MTRPRTPYQNVVVSTCMIGRSGPPPHSSFALCGVIGGMRYHVRGMVAENTHEPAFSPPSPCSGGCAGWIVVGENAVAWLRGIAARRAIREPMRGAV